MTDAQKPLIIGSWQSAMADSEHLGHALMLKADIESFPGAIKVKNEMLPMAISVNSGIANAIDFTPHTFGFGFDLRTDAELATGNNFLGAAVTLTNTGGALPTGLSAGTVYYLIYVDNFTCKFATTEANARAGTAVAFSDNGTGTQTMTAVPIGTMNYVVQDPRTGYYYFHDSNGRVWHSQGSNTTHILGGNTLTAAAGNGLATFRTSDGNHTYLFVFRNGTIDVIDVFGDTQINSPSWTTGWKSLNSGSGSGNPHYAIVGQDNIVYFVDDRYVGSIVENAGSVFDPSSSGTYTYNNQALTMPQGEINQWLDELGTNLLVAGGTYNYIYPWDRISNSFTLPLRVPEKKIYRLKNLGNLIYILAGTKGNVYTTQGTYVKFFKKVPFYAINNSYSTFGNAPMAWGGIAAGTGSLLVGVTASTGYSGVYRIYPDGRILIDQQAYNQNIGIPCIWANDDFYVTGYAGGMDYSDSVHQYSNYDTVYHSKLYKVADKTRKATYSQVEIQLAKALPSGNSHARVSYRFDSTSNFTVLATFTLDNTNTSFNTDIGLTNIENIQLQVELDGQIELAEVRLFP